MMGIYIPNVRKPKMCMDCPFDGAGRYCAVVRQYKYAGGEKPCPIIQVKDHGRLIDADKLIATLKRQIQAHEKQAKRADEKGTGYTNDMYIVDRNRDFIAFLEAESISAVIPADKHTRKPTVECNECKLLNNCPIQEKKNENEGNPFKKILGCNDGVPRDGVVGNKK